jgi:hypothetical protein
VNFGFTPPDPQKILESMDRIKTAFENAAAADTGAAQPLFQSLSDKFNKVITDGMDMAAQNPNPNQVMRSLMPVMMELQKTVMQLQKHAQTDSRVADALADLENSIKAEVQTLMGSLPGIPGIPGLGRGNNKPPAPPKPPKPKKPGNGSFDL